jgi:hypothetical protein
MHAECPECGAQITLPDGTLANEIIAVLIAARNWKW